MDVRIGARSPIAATGRFAAVGFAGKTVSTNAQKGPGNVQEMVM
jgi:hypothetical protein